MPVVMASVAALARLLECRGPLLECGELAHQLVKGFGHLAKGFLQARAAAFVSLYGAK